MAFFTSSSTSVRLGHENARSPSVYRLVSQTSRFVKLLKNGWVRGMEKAASPKIMQAAFASVNFGLKEKARAEEKAFDFSRSPTGKVTEILRARVSAMTDSILDFVPLSTARQCVWANIACTRACISSGATSSLCVATHQRCPKGSSSWPDLSP